MTRAVARCVLIALLAGTGAFSASSLEAQSARPSRGPTVQSLRAGAATVPSVGRSITPAPTPALPATSPSAHKQSALFMIIGGAALVGGGFVPGGAGRVISIAGGGVFVYGLYLFLD